MATFDEIRDMELRELERLPVEIGEVYRDFVLPRFNEAVHADGNAADHRRDSYPRMLYGFLMNAFSFVDLFSNYRYADTAGRQTPRMQTFLEDYQLASHREAVVAVKLWRHVLMHTGNPRLLVDSATGDEYLYLLHWGDWLPRAEHMVLRQAGTRQALNVGVAYFVDDLVPVCRRVFQDLVAAGLQQRAIDVYDNEIFRQPFEF